MGSFIKAIAGLHSSLVALLFWLLLSLSFNVNAQVDPQWLQHWNKANTLKPSSIESSGRIASKGESGTPMVIQGHVFTPNETPAAGVLIHAYHRDAQGYDFGKGDTEFDTWRLQGWAKTDSNGNFVFKTIRPAPDHIGREGPHIHFTTVSDQYGRQWAPKVFLSDDPSLTEQQRLDSEKAGKFGWIAQVSKRDGVQHISINIKLKEKGDF